MATCNALTARGYRRFWTTKPATCGTYQAGCNGDTLCGSPGLQIDEVRESCSPAGCYDPCGPRLIGKTINTDDYAAGLALNILGTNAERDATPCGLPPGTRGGYWADAFRGDGMKSGSRLRYLPSSGSMNELVALAEAYAKADLQKLVKYGVASDVNVTASYEGGNAIAISAEIIGTDGRTSRVNVSGSRLQNAWVWA